MKQNLSKYLRNTWFLLFLLWASPDAGADTSYHLIGWVNTFVPGGGEMFNGEPGLALLQAGLEVGTFGWGYSLSAHSPFSLDGVPERIPTLESSAGMSVAPLNINRALSADILQEVGIKYHMVNVYNSYRKAAGNSDPRIDQTPTDELFLAPFRGAILRDPLVYIPLTITFGALAANYAFTASSGVTPRASLTGSSNGLYALTYGLVFPVGSGAPEEMFYRGFLQSEFYHWVPSPYFSVPLSTLVFTLSHLPEDMPGAAVSGLFLGTLAHLESGQLSKGIAFHFWADVLVGLFNIALLQKAEFYPTSKEVFNFSWQF